MKRKYIAIALGITMSMATALTGCAANTTASSAGSTAASSAATEAETGDATSYTSTTVYGEVAAVDGGTITLNLGNMDQDSSELTLTGETAEITVYGTRPKYHYVLESVVLEEKPTDRERFEDDTEGKYCYYVDQTKLKTEGHGSCRSEGWIVSYDWNTKEEVSREQISFDAYAPGVTVYWQGVHPRR